MSDKAKHDPTELAATVRQGLLVGRWQSPGGEYDAAVAALDALLAQAETAEDGSTNTEWVGLTQKLEAAEAEREEAERLYDECEQRYTKLEAERDRLDGLYEAQARLAKESATAYAAMKAERDELRERLRNDPAITRHVDLVALEAERDAAREALRQIAESSGGIARAIARDALTENEGCEYHRPLIVKGCRDCDALTGDTT